MKAKFIYLNIFDKIAKVELKKNAQAKKLIIKVNNIEDKIELIIPLKVSFKQAEIFLFSSQNWLRARYKPITQNVIYYQNGTELPVLGNKIIISHTGNMRGITYIEDSKLFVSGLIEQLPLKVENFLSKYLYNFAKNYADQVIPLIGNNYNYINIRKMKTRWGSCSSNGKIGIALALIFAPQDIIKYVIVHELCHLIEMNHSIKFWRLVASIVPDYKLHVHWLKKNGQQLFNYKKNAISKNY